MPFELNVPGIDYTWQEAPEGKSESYVLIAMHGRGGSKDDFEQLQEIWKIPKLNYLLLQAPDPFFGGWSWYDLPPSPLPGILRSQDLLAQIMDQLARQGYPQERCILFGFSQGCLLVYEFGLRYPKRLAGYIGICGQMFDLWKLIAEIEPSVAKGAWLFSAGIEDDHFAIETTRIQAQRLQEAGVNVEYREWHKGHEIEHNKELSFLREWIVGRMG